MKTNLYWINITLKKLHLDFPDLRFYYAENNSGYHQTIYFHTMKDPSSQAVVGFGGGLGNNVPVDEDDYIAYCKEVTTFLENRDERPS